MDTCNGINVIAAILMGVLLLNIALIYMVGVVRQEVRTILRKWKETLE